MHATTLPLHGTQRQVQQGIEQAENSTALIYRSDEALVIHANHRPRGSTKASDGVRVLVVEHIVVHPLLLSVEHDLAHPAVALI
ncbi:MAG: hypothetical protein NTZ76_02995 [Actinobacteria bacterium]|nr:hypothetical protein [Actinomycetota bacterium]